MLWLETYWKSDGGDVSLGRLHQEVHPEVHQLLFVGRLLHSSLIKVLVDQDGLHQRAQIPKQPQKPVNKQLNKSGANFY